MVKQVAAAVELRAGEAGIQRSAASALASASAPEPSSAATPAAAWPSNPLTSHNPAHCCLPHASPVCHDDRCGGQGAAAAWPRLQISAVQGWLGKQGHQREPGGRRASTCHSCRRARTREPQGRSARPRRQHGWLWSWRSRGGRLLLHGGLRCAAPSRQMRHAPLNHLLLQPSNVFTDWRCRATNHCSTNVHALLLSLLHLPLLLPGRQLAACRSCRLSCLPERVQLQRQVQQRLACPRVGRGTRRQCKLLAGSATAANVHIAPLILGC